MTLRTVVVVVLALICGVSAIIVVYQLRQVAARVSRRHRPRSDGEKQHPAGQHPER